MIKATGVMTKKQAPDILLAIGIYSPDGATTSSTCRTTPPSSSTRDLTAAGHQRSQDVRAAQLQHADLAGPRQAFRPQHDRHRRGDGAARAESPGGGRPDGQSPTIVGQQTQVTLSTLGRLSEIRDFENVIVKTTPEGEIVRIRDVGSVKLGAKNEDVSSRVDGHPIRIWPSFICQTRMPWRLPTLSRRRSRS